MIDPKFNELPVDAEGDFEHIYDNSLSVEDNPERARAARQGLSITDTIASDSLLSVGARGLDTSGVEAGSGAGAGLTFVTPGTAGESPAPEIAPGATGSGMTPLSDGAEAQEPSLHFDSSVSDPVGTSSSASASFGTTTSSEAIAARAYELWCERGCPHGTSDLDWNQAEEELRIQNLYKTTSA